MPDTNVTAAYDHRFGLVQLSIDNKVRLRFKDLITQLGITREEILALCSPEYQWTEGDHDIEPARRRLIDATNWQDKIVLDIGGYAGDMAARALELGATRAICLDNRQYEHYGWEDRKHEGVEYVTGDGFDWKEPVDVVIAYNLAYHVKSPWYFFEHLHKITKSGGEMLLCTLVKYSDQPVFYLYESRECNSEDESVFWGPSISGLERLLKCTGWSFEQIGLAYDRVVYRCRPTLQPEFRQSRY